MSKRESGIQKRTVDLLYKSYTNIVARVKHGTVYAVAGDPDIYGCVSFLHIKGRMFAFEVKNEDGELTLIQRHRLEEFRKAGAITGAIRSPEEAVEILSRNILQLRGKV